MFLLILLKTLLKSKEKSCRRKVIKSVKPGDLVVKIVRDTLVELLSFNLKDEDFDLLLNKIQVYFMVGLREVVKLQLQLSLQTFSNLKRRKFCYLR